MLVRKFILEAEKQWDEGACNHNKSPETVLADDFWGLLPMERPMRRLKRSKALRINQSRRISAHQINPRVRLFGENVALVYGKVCSVRKGTNGKDAPRCLAFTDTWLKRDGKWQIVAAHDTQIPCRE